MSSEQCFQGKSSANIKVIVKSLASVWWVEVHYAEFKVCSASVRKSLQGLDYFSADGAKAYDDLEEIVQKLGDEHGASLTWAKHQSEKLKKSKRYLKTDYKVSMKRKIIQILLRL